MEIHIYMFTILYVAMIVLGLSTNVYLAKVIWKSGTVWKKMRNKILMSLCVLHLLQTTVSIPLRIVNYLLPVFVQEPEMDLLSSIHLHLERIPSMVESVSLLVLMVTYTCNISNCQCVVEYSSLDRRFVAGLCVALPWIFSLYAVPSIIRHFEVSANGYSVMERNSSLTKQDSVISDSSFTEQYSSSMFMDASYWLSRLELVTLLICAALLCTAVQLRRNEMKFLEGLQQHHPFYASLRREVDSPVPYAVVVAVSVAHVLVWVICIHLKSDTLSTQTSIVKMVTYLLSDARVVAPVVWLFHNHVRDVVPS
ncbi:uncharacterized protein LOC131952314 [Physella acuta]|uniref:uncharacterized protein LOC131952314 n=1 Tax=Physella acuta TaxID=109671 RepID=UPI0027DC6466|nr:uncharacterized protein LOC131952314 [Physella acuta]